MQKTKEHAIIVRGFSKNQKNHLKRLAADKNQSVNGFILSTVKGLIELDIESQKKEKK